VNRAHLKVLRENEEFFPESMVFSLRDLRQDYSLGLPTVLQCLRRAEIIDAVPPLSAAWWLLLSRKYGQDFLRNI
jgi:hypothetical protein